MALMDPKSSNATSASVRNFIILLGSFVIFLCFQMPQTGGSPYYLDDFCNFQDVKKISSKPLAPFLERNYKEPRHHPLFAYLLFLEHKLFGLDLRGYYAVLFLFHFLNCFLVVRLAQALGADSDAALFSGLLFLFSSAFYTVLILVACAAYATCLFFFLLGLLSWIEFIRQRHLTAFLKSCAFLVLALLNSEAAFIFPFLAFFLASKLAIPADNRRRVLFVYLPLLTLVCGLTTFYLFHDFFHTAAHNRGSLASLPGLYNFIPKVFSLFKVLLQPLLIPEKGFFPFPKSFENLFRLFPFFISTAIVITLLRRKTKTFFQEVRSPLIGIGAGWIAITALPYLPIKTTFENAVRYVYFPMVGFCLIAGIFISGFFKTMRAAKSCAGIFWGFILVGYMLGLNLTTYKYHFTRYREYVLERPEEGYYPRIVELFRS